MPHQLTKRTFMAAGLASLAASRLRRADASERINSRIAGEGKPTLIFVHGFGCTLEDWSAQFSGLSSSFKCIALDLPGHGSSAMPDEPSIAALAAAVNEVKTESAGGNTVLIGHSMGVKVIREAYRQSSQGVRGLVFVDSSIYVGDQDVLIAKQREAIAKAGFYNYTEGLFAQMFVAGSDEQLKQRIVARSRNLDAALGEELLVDSIRWELSKGAEALKDIAVPTLVIQSTYYNSDFKRVSLEPGVSTPFMDEVKATIPGSEIKVVLGVGHFPMIEAAETVNTYIADFARKIRV